MKPTHQRICKIHAVKWSPEIKHPLVFKDERATHREDWYIKLPSGRRAILPGEWIVTYPDEEIDLLPDHEIDEYEPIEQDKQEEETTGLDKEGQEAIWRLLRRLSVSDLADESNIPPRIIISAAKGKGLGICHYTDIMQMIHGYEYDGE